ncbi:MAG: hypothetical protein JWN18_479 [Parcubacteria group bacterium]|nr:hypothetical protein [Parcubacteria group bacterium]
MSLAAIVNRILLPTGIQLRKANSDQGFWSSDKEFMTLYKEIAPYTLVGLHKSFMLYQCARFAAQHLVGDVAQLGVYKGGSAKMIAECFKETDRKVYLFDTFEGLPGDGEGEAGMFNDVQFAEVETRLSPYKNVEFRKGFFPDTAQGLEGRKFSFVYLDGDMYESEKDGLNFFYPRLVPGGIIMLDDYESPKWVGVKRAVDEFTNETGVAAIHTAYWQCAIIKPPLG